jgi:hypothetical protein
LWLFLTFVHASLCKLRICSWAFFSSFNLPLPRAQILAWGVQAAVTSWAFCLWTYCSLSVTHGSELTPPIRTHSEPKGLVWWQGDLWAHCGLALASLAGLPLLPLGSTNIKSQKISRVLTQASICCFHCMCSGFRLEFISLPVDDLLIVEN